MRNVKRFFSCGNTYFLTHVTYKRRLILIDNVDLLWNAINKYNKLEPFYIIAWAILPDHWHLIIDPKRNDLSRLMKRIKLSFAQRFIRSNGNLSGRTWQRRFWDHMIRNETDMNRHIDYIHYSPVKHGITKAPFDYEYSSFREFVDDGMYSDGWGSRDVVNVDGEYGE